MACRKIVLAWSGSSHGVASRSGTLRSYSHHSAPWEPHSSQKDLQKIPARGQPLRRKSAVQPGRCIRPEPKGIGANTEHLGGLLDRAPRKKAELDQLGRDFVRRFEVVDRFIQGQHLGRFSGNREVRLIERNPMSVAATSHALCGALARPESAAWSVPLQRNVRDRSSVAYRRHAPAASRLVHERRGLQHLRGPRAPSSVQRAVEVPRRRAARAARPVDASPCSIRDSA